MAPSHQAWAQQAERKVSKRYGHMIKSEAERMPDMLLNHRRDVTDFILAAADLDSEPEEEETQEDDDYDEIKAEDKMGEGEIRGRTFAAQNGTSTTIGKPGGVPAPIRVSRETIETPPRSAGLAGSRVATAMEDVNSAHPNSASSMAEGLASGDPEAARNLLR